MNELPDEQQERACPLIRRKITEDFTLRQFQKRFEALSNQSHPGGSPSGNRG